MAAPPHVDFHVALPRPPELRLPRSPPRSGHETPDRSAPEPQSPASAAHPFQPRDLRSQHSRNDRPGRSNQVEHGNQQDPNDPGLEIREVGLGRVVAQQFRRGIDPLSRATPPASATPHRCSSRPIGRLSQCGALVAPPEELPRRPNETVHRSYPRDFAKAPPPRRHPPQPKRPLPPPPSCPLSPLTPLLRVRVFRSRPHAPTRSPVPLSLSERTSLLIAQNDPLRSPRAALQVVLTICTLGVCPPHPPLESPCSCRPRAASSPPHPVSLLASLASSPECLCLWRHAVLRRFRALPRLAPRTPEISQIHPKNPPKTLSRQPGPYGAGLAREGSPLHPQASIRSWTAFRGPGRLTAGARTDQYGARQRCERPCAWPMRR